ncbi:YeeE/YedE family protein [Candidatus Sulfurimonas marisnigri]|uniref:YeeE/YedE family protein n=1 Tax=Candidatus Sulfurimonas marisnigri TaxID=2740405 RepID=A0A7S7RRK0_9BACT|nr:YeeE/YedE thiosulfate transporter family protein [Candidatus Sulfurimonas marisnigri]QOY55650.1 YeeE/YedE family protein [Candidatus Sulfurimonas marisnigri]
MKNKQPRAFLSPLTAGIGLGLALMFMFLITGHGIGASGFFVRLSAWLSDTVVPVWTENNNFFFTFAANGNPLNSWISWEIAGVALGALVGSFMSGRFRFNIERGQNIGVYSRVALALGGGILTGFGAKLAHGCTSGLGLSGGATLAVAAFVFLIAFFVAGILVSLITRRIWQ